MELLFFNPKKTLVLVLAVIFFFCLSFLGYLYSGVNNVVFWLISLLALLLTVRRLEYGVFLILTELFIGSKGYLFSFPFFNFVVSLRLSLFIIVLIVYLVKLLKRKKVEFFETNLWLAFGIFVLFLIISLVNGLYHNQLKVVFFDVNAYFYFALIFPVFTVLSRRENIIRLIRYLSVGALSLSILTFIVMADFSLFHYSPSLVAATRLEAQQLEKWRELSTLPENARLAQTTQIAAEKLKLNWQDLTKNKNFIYRWLQDTGLGEVSYLGGRFFRVFMSSQFYIAIYFLIVLSFILSRKKFSIKKDYYLYIGVFLLLGALLISFSRSFWSGLLAGFIILLIGLPLRRIYKIIAFSFSILVLFVVISYFILPNFNQIFISRITSLFKPTTELAASNRVSLLTPILEKMREKPFFGSGFGTLVTYKTFIAGTDLVEYVKVYVYEWAYLDILVKMGFLGLISYLYFIYVLTRNYFQPKKVRKSGNNFLLKGLLAGLIFLAVINITTPYLNHPIGIGFIIFSAAILYYKKEILFDDSSEKSLN